MGMLGIYRKHLWMASLPNEKRNRQNKIETRYVSHSFCFRLRSKQTKRWLLEYKVRYHADCRHHSICTHTCFYCIATASFSFHKAYLLCLWLCFSIIFVFQSKFIARSQYYYRRSSSSSVCKFFFLHFKQKTSNFVLTRRRCSAGAKKNRRVKVLLVGIWLCLCMTFWWVQPFHSFVQSFSLQFTIHTFWETELRLVEIEKWPRKREHIEYEMRYSL